MGIFTLNPQHTITDSDVNRAIRLLIVDGIFGQAMLVFSAGPVLVAFALLMGASHTVIGILATLAPMAQILQIPSIFLVERMRKRKYLVFWAGFVSRAMLLFIACVPFIPWKAAHLPLFTVLLLIHFGVGAVGNCAFMSWVRDTMPQEKMSDFFSKRLAVANLSGAALSLITGIALDVYRQQGGDAHMAYSILYLVGGLLGISSIVLMAFVPEPQMPETNEPFDIIRILKEPFRDIPFRKLLLFTGAWNFAVFFAAPFFGVYMIERLGLSMGWVLGLTVLTQLFNTITFRIWSRLGEQHSDKAVLAVAVPMFFTMLLIWPFTTLPEKYFLTIPLLIVAHVIWGMSNAGVALCAQNLALKTAPYGKATAYLSVNALVGGVASIFAPLVAGMAGDGMRTYELKLSLSWIDQVTNNVLMEIPALDLRGLDFVFLMAVGLGLYAVRRVSRIRETGEIQEAAVRREFFLEMRRMARQISTVEGLRQLSYIPIGMVREASQRRAEKGEDQWTPPHADSAPGPSWPR